MPSLNFQERFAEAIATGRKKQSIRATKRFKAGDKVYLFTGMRTKKCRRLGTGTVTWVYPITIDHDLIVLDTKVYESRYTLDFWAREDGFESWREMADWFEAQHGLPFRCWLIKWELDK